MKHLLLGAVAALACLTPTAVTAQEAGEVVLAFYKGGSWLYPATVRSVSGKWVTVDWDTGTTSVVDAIYIGPFDWGVGSNIFCKWPVDGKFYPARITRMGDDGRSLNIVWTDDNTAARTTTGKCRSAG